ncbi:MAG: hypothetical protein FVQ83_16015 [Chloroflexi bacterium]|nr:hypothetical protein [Chloroflexota bacterium]
MTEMTVANKLDFGPRRGKYFDVLSYLEDHPTSADDLEIFEDFDLLYRTLCGIMFNFAPTSGHPGGSISSGRIVEGLLFQQMSYAMNAPDLSSADMISYAAGHKALGLYAMWALRNECARISNASLLPGEKDQLRLEDLLGFRKNPTQETPLFHKYNAKALDGHPSPSTPFVKNATGASGVGVPAAFGLAFGALDMFTADAPIVHVIEGEGGMTAGRVSEALATAATAQLWNVRLHLDWNQASIDSNQVTREGDQVGDYVQWTPVELCYLNDWNVIFVEDGKDFGQVFAAQELAKERINDQPTAIVYRTIKGWKYGIEGRKSHGAGHAVDSEGYYRMLQPAVERFGVEFPHFEGEVNPTSLESVYFDTLMAVRHVLEDKLKISDFIAGRVESAGNRLQNLKRQPRENKPQLDKLYTNKVIPEKTPAEMSYKPGDQGTLRGALGDTLRELNKITNGAFIGAAADLIGSTSIVKLGGGFPDGFYNSSTNPKARLITTGGICEDCMGAFMSGLASYGAHVGVGSSYGAFIAALEHIAARLHGIGQQAKNAVSGEPYNTFIIVCAHAGLKTGEDGPTHADPQALQLMQENFPKGVSITLTPWEPQELWPLTTFALKQRPAVLVPFVTRPVESIVDRQVMKLPPASASVTGVYAFRKADRQAKPYHGTLILQGSEVANSFVSEVLPRMDEAGLNMNVFYVSSAELFSMLPEQEQAEIYPPELAAEAMGITGFTLPTMYRWVTSQEGRQRTLHAFTQGHYLGSGQAHKVLEEAKLHGEGQWEAIEGYARWIAGRK